MPLRLPIAGLLALACLAPAAAHAACRFPVASFAKPPGAPAEDMSALVALADLKLTPHAVGYGAAGERRDEITIEGGRFYLVRPDGPHGHSTRHAAGAGEGALFVHVAPVEAWSAKRPLGPVPSLDALAAQLDAAVAAAGCKGGATLAFRIEGVAKTATWGLDTRPERRELESRDRPVVIVGVYSTDAGAYAIPAGRRFHAHLVSPGEDGAGHLRAVALADGASIRLQAR